MTIIFLIYALPNLMSNNILSLTKAASLDDAACAATKNITH